MNILFAVKSFLVDTARLTPHHVLKKKAVVGLLYRINRLAYFPYASSYRIVEDTKVLMKRILYLIK